MAIMIKADKDGVVGIATLPVGLLAKLGFPDYLRITYNNKKIVFKTKPRDKAEGEEIHLAPETFGLTTDTPTSVNDDQVKKISYASFFASELTSSTPGWFCIAGLALFLVGIFINMAFFFGEHLFSFGSLPADIYDFLDDLAKILSSAGGVLTFISGMKILGK